MVNLVDYSVTALGFAPVSSVLMCSAAAARIGHQQVMMLMAWASCFDRPPLTTTMAATNNHQFFQIVAFALDPVDKFDAVDMDSRIVDSRKLKCARVRKLE